MGASTKKFEFVEVLIGGNTVNENAGIMIEIEPGAPMLLMGMRSK